MTRDQALEIARRAAGGKNQPSYCEMPASFEPHAWVIDAIIDAFELGRRTVYEEE